MAASALLALEMKRLCNRPVVLITESATLMDEMRRNLSAFAGEADETILDYPFLEDVTAGQRQTIITGERLRALAQIGNYHQPFLLNTCVQALMQKTVSPVFIKENSLPLAAGQEYDPDRLTAWIEKAGYEFAPEVQEKSQAARRGGLIDVWPSSEPGPLRLEFDGLKIESIRLFDPVDQCSCAKRKEIILPPASETALHHVHPDSYPQIQNPQPQTGPLAAEKHKIENSYDSLARYLPTETIFFWTEKYQPVPASGARRYGGIAYHAEVYEKAAADAGRAKLSIPLRALTDLILDRRGRQYFAVFEEFFPAGLPLIEHGFRPVQDIGFSPQSFLTPDSAHENRRHWLALLEKKARAGMKVHFFFDTPGALDRFQSIAGEAPGGLLAKKGETLFHLHLGAISDGFLHEELRLAVVSESGLLLRAKALRRHSEIRAQRLAKRRSMAGETITDWTSIAPGDLVVHVNHGIGKYLGLYEIVFNGKLQETFAVEYADRVKLYVPVSQAHLLSRYMTAGGRRAKIHRLGGGQWLKEKQSARKAIYDLAAALLETQALRETFVGFAFPADAVWQHDFETAFPYEETDDQDDAIRAIKADMESSVPMDRLICGDAGYGKTEVAMRAAFKAVMAGKQVAVLVPTTVLALQHYEVFQQRMKDYPVRVELLCRFRSAAEQQSVVGELRKGAVDIVIGTHRLLQPDLGFKDLGLIIIDEEQRFGVVNKEHLKQLKKLADVLTLTATPIPRTLYMSLTGAKKVSMVQTPPKARLPIETIVAKNDDRLVRETILREINRGGQVFYLHNRVATIERVGARLKSIVPEARVAIAHGQMAARELADKMHAFGKGEFDVLLCTTIVESGVDLPNVNTILIDRADRFGIADLYQLRGRVGRSDRKAYAYLLTPVHGHLLDISRRRLQAIMEHSQLGSGFRLAMMDLEIRGAGNLLGTEQSGHIAAIGFDLYCRLLRRAVASVRTGGQPRVAGGLPESAVALAAEMIEVEVNLDFITLAAKSDDLQSAAFLPAAYIADEPTRVNVYRKIASAATPAEIEALRVEFSDRFGPLPAPFERALKIATVRVLAAGRNISVVEVKSGKLMFKRRGEYLQINNQFPRLRATDTDGKLQEIAHWLGRI